MLQSKTKFCKTFYAWKSYKLKTQIWKPSKIKCLCNKLQGTTVTKQFYSLEFLLKLGKQVEDMWCEENKHMA
jgi:hypothetical protein